ncbi:hypothetical protein ACFQW6_13765 [Nocardioides sp. GCM10028917]|uniref:hypothetical protein n=1 Tax=Nocardioides sp. GCM10028917 TaxID=3273408 RepID=UPI003606D148
MNEWVTHRQAAELLGVHVSLIPKMLRRGDLTTRGAWPSLSRAEVGELAAVREARAAERAAKRQQRRPATQPQPASPPDDGHEWLPLAAAAAVLGCSEGALKMRATRGRVPYMVHDGRRWFRLDHLELWLRARAARSTVNA